MARGINRLRKDVQLKAIERCFEGSKLVLVTSLGQLMPERLEAFRSQVMACGGGMKVVKCSLARVVAKRLGYDVLGDMFKGTSAVVYSGVEGDVKLALLALKFAQNNPPMHIVGGKLQQQELTPDHVEKYTKLKAAAVNTELVSAIAPMSRAHTLVRLLSPSSNIRIPPVSGGLVRVLDAWVQKTSNAG